MEKDTFIEHLKITELLLKLTTKKAIELEIDPEMIVMAQMYMKKAIENLKN